jgi:hypothetical protein
MSWNRVADEKNALSALAQVDPVLAFKLFESIDPIVPLPSGEVPEDVRAYGAITIFGQYWKRTGFVSLDQIRLRAAQLADTGQYPFAAMVPIIRDVDGKDHLQAQAIFAEGLSGYSHGRQMESTDEEFAGFLLELWDIIPRPLEQQGLHTLVSHLIEDSAPPQGKMFFNRSTSEKGTAQFSSRAQKLLFSLLPKIRDVDPQLADRLVETESFLRQPRALREPDSEEVTIENTNGVSTTDINAVRAVVFEQEKLVRISKLASSDPAQALALSSSLGNKALRDDALATIASELSSQDPRQAKSLIDQVNRDIDSIGEPSSNIKVIAALARAAAVNNDRTLLLKCLKRGFDVGEELYSEDFDVHPGKMAEDYKGFEALSKLSSVGVKYAPEITLPRINQISNELLRAHLLLGAAEDLSEVRRSSDNLN